MIQNLWNTKQFCKWPGRSLYLQTLISSHQWYSNIQFTSSHQMQQLLLCRGQQQTNYESKYQSTFTSLHNAQSHSKCSDHTYTTEQGLLHVPLACTSTKQKCVLSLYTWSLDLEWSPFDALLTL